MLRVPPLCVPIFGFILRQKYVRMIWIDIRNRGRHHLTPTIASYIGCNDRPAVESAPARVIPTCGDCLRLGGRCDA